MKYLSKEPIFFGQIARLAVKDPATCKHPEKSFNGYVWRCKECGKVLKG